ncbi:MAG: hypothetical protein JWM77_3831 [Rhodospirillales bacterium]|nr:hypothetical protein [Rhodospirillales bacterium]
MAMNDETFNLARARIHSAGGETVRRIDFTPRAQRTATEVLRGRKSDAPG